MATLKRPKQLREAVRTQNHKCYLCGFAMGMNRQKARNIAAHEAPAGATVTRRAIGGILATKEHVEPRSNGGTSKAPNIRAACGCCNAIKGDLTVSQARARISVLLERGWHPRQIWRRRGVWFSFARLYRWRDGDWLLRQTPAVEMAELVTIPALRETERGGFGKESG